MKFINIGPLYIRGGREGMGVMAKAKTKKQDDINGRVKSGYDIHIHIHP